MLGGVEGERFHAVALHQGRVPKARAKGAMHGGAEIAGATAATTNAEMDPTIVCAAYKRNRFYLFSRREPEDDLDGTGRDIFNERPTRDERSVALAVAGTAASKEPASATIHTSMGDIVVSLLPKEAPKAVENWTTHAKQDYYNGIIFHRVIKAFMLQTGDPLGNGTGGTSIWGRKFEDEFAAHLQFDKPGVLAMANAGPKTNGSQFFITTAPCTWLNGKHTIFGRVTAGMDVVHAIENVATDKRDKPYDDVQIQSITVKDV